MVTTERNRLSTHAGRSASGTAASRIVSTATPTGKGTLDATHPDRRCERRASPELRPPALRKATRMPFRFQESHREAVTLRQNLGGRFGKVEPDEKPLEVEPESDPGQNPPWTFGLVHGARDLPDLDFAAAKPFEVARFLAVERRTNEAGRIDLRRGRSADRDVGDEEFVGNGPLRAADRRSARCRRKRSSNSRSWSDEWSSPYHQNQSLPSAIRISSRACAACLVADLAGDLERVARLGQLAPGALVVRVADPDVEVRVDPRAGEDAGQHLRRRPRRPRPS